jgi:hypothetical protein
MNNLSIIFYTDNSLDEVFAKRIQKELFKAAEGKRIISVSQKPIDFARNICVGDIGRSHHSLFFQVLTGVKEAKTKYIALAEHDCMYTPEHFNWLPPRDDVFYYNVNMWFVQWNNKLAGQYSYFRRKTMSNLICSKDLCISAVEEKILMLETGFEIRKGQPGACEPGVCNDRQAFIEAKAQEAKQKDLGKEDKYTAMGFRTTLPNLDIRHGNNFSGNRRTKKIREELPYWGRFSDVINNG